MMDGFEFVFGLFGLILGLALAEGLSGLARSIKARHRVRIGWPTALLGLFVSCDVVTFWMYGWVLRDKIPVTWPFLFGGFVITAIYFVSASLVFPEDPEEWVTQENGLDAHFDAQYRLVLGGVLICNIALQGLTIWLMGDAYPQTLRTAIITWSFFPVSVLAILSRRRWLTMLCLIWLIALYPLSVVWTG